MRRGGGEYHDPREDHFRASNGRIPNQFPPAPEPAPHPQDSASFSPHTDDAGYPAPPPGKFRDARFARPENRRTQSSRSNNVRSARVEPQGDDPRLSPAALRNEVPLPPRHEFVPPPPRDGASSHRRTRNGDRAMPENHASPMGHEPIPPPHVERDLHPDVRQDERIPRHRRSISGGEYLTRRSLSPQITCERDLPDVSPPRHSYPGRPRDFSPQGLAEPREPDFMPRDREPERYAPKGRREQHEPYPRGLRQEDPMPRVYEAPSVPHARRIVPRDSETLAPGRIYPPAESQRPPSPVPAAREAYPRRYVRDDQFPEHPPRDWDREDQVPTAPEEARHIDRKSQPGARRVQREAVSDTEYVDPRTGGRSRRRTEGRPPSRFEKPEAEARPNYQRHATRDDNQPYEPEDRQWTPRDAPPPLPHVRSPVAQMEVDPPPVPLAEKPLAGWADFHRRRERSPERRESYRPRASARDSWHPANEDQDLAPEIIEGGKRQRIEGGTRMIQPFNHREEELPRKVPQHSPSQRPKIHSPNNSLLKLPPPALTVQPAVDFQAAVSRAKDVASQLAQANPQHKPRPKSRFDQPSDPNIAIGREVNRALLVPNSSSCAFGVVHTSETAVSPDTNGRSSPEEINDGRHGSEGSHSSHIVSRMDEASLRDKGYPQKHAERHRDSRLDTGPSRRDRNRSDRNGRNNGDKSSRFIDSYRPADENPGRGPGGMRAWGNPEIEPHRDPPPHTSTPSTNRVYRNAGDRGFSRPHIVISPEGLPPRPPTPTEFTRGARNRGQTGGQVRSPPGKSGRSYTTITDVDTAETTLDNENDPLPAAGFTFRQASATSPRKYSLLDRMTDPNSGARLTVPPKDRGNNGNGQQQQRRARSNRAGSRR
ncbi:Serine/arginine repetitive matrix protein 1 [Rhizoctonia solani]|uniref:Serine/arginine repetitive matrix protein 1 n=1 Tax=Rhizoctonia solani TaxID=456999 RepID=A0A0K6FQJ0_9AGAM|nr:Serine/arginine repetitive matrix protein 1 [Rhizoctonia solani]